MPSIITSCQKKLETYMEDIIKLREFIEEQSEIVVTEETWIIKYRNQQIRFHTNNKRSSWPSKSSAKARLTEEINGGYHGFERYLRDDRGMDWKDAKKYYKHLVELLEDSKDLEFVRIS